MRPYFKIYAKIMVCTLVAALFLSGFLSIAHASTMNGQSDAGYPLAMTEYASAEDMDKSDGHSHHLSGEQECHSVSCNLYSHALNSLSSDPTYEGIVFVASTEQRVRSLLASLYRPPRFVL